MGHVHALLAAKYELFSICARDLSIDGLCKSESDLDTRVIIFRKGKDFVEKLLHVVLGRLRSMGRAFRLTFGHDCWKEKDNRPAITGIIAGLMLASWHPRTRVWREYKRSALHHVSCGIFHFRI